MELPKAPGLAVRRAIPTRVRMVRVPLEWAAVTHAQEWRADCPLIATVGEKGQKHLEGVKHVVGVRDRGLLVLEEAEDEEANTSQLVFHRTFDNSHRIRVIGYNVGSKGLTIVHFALVR